MNLYLKAHPNSYHLYEDYWWYFYETQLNVPFLELMSLYAMLLTSTTTSDLIKYYYTTYKDIFIFIFIFNSILYGKPEPNQKNKPNNNYLVINICYGKGKSYCTCKII